MALVRAAQSEFLNSSAWFDLGWFLQNDDHYERCLNGKYDNKGAAAVVEELTEEEISEQNRKANAHLFDENGELKWAKL
jgi:hypothetical protein